MNAMETQQAKPAAPARAAAPANAASATGKPGEGAAPEDAFAALLEGLVPQQGEDPTATPAAAETLPVPADAGPAQAGPARASAQPAAPESFLAMLMPAATVAGASNAPGGKLAAASDAGADTRTGAGRAPAAAAPAGRRPDAVPDAFLAAASDVAARQAAPGGFASALSAATATAAVEERREPLAALPDAGAPGNLAGAAAQPATALDLAAAAPVHEAALASHPLEAAFAGDLAAEVQWMVDAGVQQADLHLNPADLGPIRIQLSLTAQTADISFAAAHGTTREGLAQALPQLREMLAGQGLQLGQAGISGGQGGERQAQPQRPAPREPARETGAVDAARPRTGTVALRAGRGMLDLYA